MTSRILNILGAALVAAALSPAQQPATPTAAKPAAATKDPAPPPAAAPAVEQPKDLVATPVGPVKRWRAGGKFSGQFLGLFEESEVTTFDSIPWKYTTANTTDISNRLSFGLTFAYDITSRVSLNVDVLYRRAGFRSGLEISEGQDDLDTDADERKITSGFQQTKVDYWDLPFTMRVHDGPATRRVRGFVEFGGALRKATSVRTYTELKEPGKTGVVDTTPTPLTNSNVFGGVAGAGWDWRTSRGVNIVPQMRYTYWMKPVFDTTRTRSSRSQIEFLLGITF